MSVATLTRETRKTRGMTLAGMGEALGVTRQAVYNWEWEKNHPDIAFLLMIASTRNDWRRDWALNCLHQIRPDVFAPVEKSEPCAEER